MPLSLKKNSEEDSLLSDIKKLFDDAEGHIKPLEHIDGLFIPTINQLRYAGRHIIDYCNGASNGVEELRRAQRHCQRAVYDANDSYIQYFLNEVECFQKDFKDVVISDVFSGYETLISAKNEALEFLETTRDDDGVSDDDQKRDQFYEECVRHKVKIKDLSEKLPIYRDELNKKVEQRRKSAISTRVSTITAIISLIIAAIALFF